MVYQILIGGNHHWHMEYLWNIWLEHLWLIRYWLAVDGFYDSEWWSINIWISMEYLWIWMVHGYWLVEYLWNIYGYLWWYLAGISKWCNDLVWLVVVLTPLKKIRVSQLGWFIPKCYWKNKSYVPVTTNQIIHKLIHLIWFRP